MPVAIFRQVVVDQIAEAVLSIGLSGPDTAYLRLFRNPAPLGIDAGKDATQFDQPTGPGYGPLVLNPALWVQVVSTGGVSSWTYPALTFVFSPGGPGETIQGFFLADHAGTEWTWAEELPGGPWAVPAGGGSYTIVLVFSDQRCVNP